MISRLFIGLAAVFVFSSATPEPIHAQAASIDPYAIFEQTQEAWAVQRYPTNIAYTIVVHIVENGTPVTESYTSSYDALHDIIHVDPISDYEREHPPDGRGVKLNLGLPFLTKRVDKQARPIDFLGVPLLEPTYSFGIGPHVTARALTSAELVNEIRAEYHDVRRSQPSDIKTIAHIVVSNRAYTISYAGREMIRGVDCDHLSLRATRNPSRNRLREVWIDRSTHRTVRALIALNFIRGVGTNVPWRIDFGMHDGALYIASETALGPVRTESSESYGASHTYSQASIAFDNLHTKTHFSQLPSFFEPPADGAILREPNDIGDGVQEENSTTRPI